jgi:hypothetical protein
MAEKTLNLSLNWQGKLQPVGILNIEDTTDGAKMFFAYHSDWIENGFSLGRDLPLTGQVFQNSRHAPLFGFLYDLIPGLTAQKIQKRIQKKDLSNIELLLESQESLRPGALVLSNHFEPLVQNAPAFCAGIECGRQCDGGDSLYADCYGNCGSLWTASSLFVCGCGLLCGHDPCFLPDPK